MQGESADVATEQVNGLMLAELGHWGDALLHSEESGEGRVTILLAAVGAAATALPVIVKPDSQPGMLLWLLPVLGLLLLMGLFTLVRLANRNLHTDFCLLQLWTIRTYFADRYPELLGTAGYPAGMVSDPMQKVRGRQRSLWHFVVGRKGGHVELVEWANAVLVGLAIFVVASALYPEVLPRWLVAAGLGAGLAFRLVEFEAVNQYYRRNDPRTDYKGLRRPAA